MKRWIAWMVVFGFTGTAFDVYAYKPSIDIKGTSLVELMNLKITSVSKTEERMSDAPASVYVITQDDIRRSGVTSIPEALRLAPGVHVARMSSHSWAISIRGFNSDITNKLLVLIDGRSVYSPLYAGVFWDVQDTLLEDVDRIEVISGPGGTLWGANAVNGVINIITRSAQDTLGGFLEVGGGNEEQGIAGFRYGGKLGENAAVRGYLKSFSRDASQRFDGKHAIDEWQMTQGGFRLDWQPSDLDHLTFQGDLYSGREDGLFRDDFTLGTLPGADFKDSTDVSGGNLLGRWERQLDTHSDIQIQAYVDYTKRDIPGAYDEARDTLDIDFQHHLKLGARHDILWGVGYRLTRDEIDSTLFATFTPESRKDETFSAFLQDKIDLWEEKLFLTLGSKFEHNDYTGYEYQPSARLTWLPSQRQTLWAAVSRAVRIPARLNTDLRLTVPLAGLPFPLYVDVKGNRDLESEELLAYEAGYRVQVRDDLSFDLSVFYNDYDQLLTQEPGDPIIVIDPPTLYIVLPNRQENGMEGESYGGTLVANWQPAPIWRLQLQYAYVDLQLHNKRGSLDTNEQDIEGFSPEHQVSLYSFLDLPHGLSLYSGVRYVDHLPGLGVGSYTALDVSLSWSPRKDLAFSITGQNLTDDGHVEFNSSVGNQVERSVFGKVTWRF
ncbi:TonB-dependent receptor [Pseudomonas sp. CrR25]|nr:TonB-dependent receptor [Pseudomonas sp. CrR25]